MVLKIYSIEVIRFSIIVETMWNVIFVDAGLLDIS